MVDKATGSDHQNYRSYGNYALAIGSVFFLATLVEHVLVGFQVLKSTSGYFSFALAAAFFLIGYVYRFDLPNIYRRIAELEQRLDKRIDALSSKHGGNGKGSVSGP